MDNWKFPLDGRPITQTFDDAVTEALRIVRRKAAVRVGDSVTFTDPDVAQWPTYTRLDARANGGEAWRLAYTEHAR